MPYLFSQIMLVRGFFKIAMNTKCAAKADNAGMESVGSCLPTGAASHAAGGENFGEMSVGQTDN